MYAALVVPLILRALAKGRDLAKERALAKGKHASARRL
jgi:hypothetical protein